MAAVIANRGSVDRRLARPNTNNIGQANSKKVVMYAAISDEIIETLNSSLNKKIADCQFDTFTTPECQKIFDIQNRINNTSNGKHIFSKILSNLLNISIVLLNILSLEKGNFVDKLLLQ